MSRAEGFAAVPNWMIRDASFDIYDIAVYAALASHTGPGGVRPSQTTLAAEARCSRRKVIDALQNLADRGVVQVVRRRRKGGGIGQHGALTNGYVLTPHGPLSEDDEFAPTDQSAHGAHTSQTNVHPTTDQSAHESNGRLYIEEEPVEEEPEGASFDVFWTIWPRKDAKKAAQTAWSKAVKRHPAEQIIFAAAAYAQSPNRPEKQYVPHATTWLNGDRWNDPLPEAPASARLSPVDMGRAAAELLLVEEPRHLRALS